MMSEGASSPVHCCCRPTTAAQRRLAVVARVRQQQAPGSAICRGAALQCNLSQSWGGCQKTRTCTAARMAYFSGSFSAPGAMSSSWLRTRAGRLSTHSTPLADAMADSRNGDSTAACSSVYRQERMWVLSTAGARLTHTQHAWQPTDSTQALRCRQLWHQPTTLPTPLPAYVCVCMPHTACGIFSHTHRHRIFCECTQATCQPRLCQRC